MKLKSSTILCAFLSCLLGTTAFGQVTRISGRIIDGSNKQPIEFASIRFSNSNNGNITDSLGRFAIFSNKPEAGIEISALGYKTRKIAVASIKNQSDFLVEMSVTAIDVKEVLVKPAKRKKREIDTAALYLLKQVQEHKDENNSKGIPNYHFYESTKLVMSLLNVPDKFADSKAIRPFRFFLDAPDTTENGRKYNPLLLQEEYNETYHRASPKLNRKVIYYRKISGLKKNFFANLVANQFVVIDIYENVYIIAGKSFPAPFSPGARLTYAFHIIDTTRNGNDVLYKINYVAKNSADVALKGYAIIDSATWGIKAISFKPNENSNINFLTDYSITQSFERFEGHWLLTGETLAAVGNLLEKQKKLSVYITKQTARDSIKANYPIPDSVQRAKEDLIVKGAFKKPRSFIDSVRIVPLDKAEQHIYAAFDTARTVPAYKRLKWVANLLIFGNVKAGPLEFGRLDQVVSQNAVEGYRVKLGIRTNELMSDKFWLYSHAAYGFTDKKWKYEVDARFILPGKYNRWHSLALLNKNDMVLLGQENTLLPFDNILTILSPNHLNRVLHTSLHGITYEGDWFKGLSSVMKFTRSQFYSEPGQYTFQYTDNNGVLTNIHRFGTTELSTNLRYSKTDQYTESYGSRYFISSKQPNFTFTYSLGFKSPIGGDYTYHKFEFQFKHVWQVPILGYAYINLKAGYMLGQVPYTAAFTSSSNISFFKDESSFQLTKPFEFVNDRYLMFWYEHHFEGLLFNQIPYIKKLKLREFVSVKALWGDYSKSNQALVGILPETHVAAPVPYIEVGAGIENILKIFQLNFFWRATYRDVGAANFGVKLGIRPSF
ncbi:MAG: TonB-linked outer membrane protein SusC/RagA family [Bacteroidota bacterium]|nr:TonB-linked outer membrane protein SusC/RagA family [Bacteroidota bacterium]